MGDKPGRTAMAIVARPSVQRAYGPGTSFAQNRRPMEFYRRYAALALSGMAELNAEQRGVYNSLIDVLYDRDGLVPDDDALVARMIWLDVRIYKRIKSELKRRGKLWVNQHGFLRVPRFETTVELAKIRSRSVEDQANIRQHLFENLSDFNDRPLITQTQTQKGKKDTSELGPGLDKRTQLNGHNLKAKPHHGQSSKKGRIWFDRGTMEFEAHAADYRDRHYGLEPPMNWNDSGAWFNIKGET